MSRSTTEEEAEMKEVSKIVAGKILEASIRSGLGYEGALVILEDILMAIVAVCVRTGTSPLYGADFRAVADRLVENAMEKYKNAPMDPAEAVRRDSAPN
jgi:hypothetical protein